MVEKYRRTQKSTKMTDLLDILGYDDEVELLEDTAMESVVPGICMNEGCYYQTDVEPDQEHGWCENCETTTVKSCLMIVGAF